MKVGTPLLVALLATACGAPPTSGPIRGPETGLDSLAREGFASLRGRHVGVITNQTGVDRSFRHIADLIAGSEDVTLAALFGPEHGVRGIAQAGAKVGDSRDRATGVPVFSLYGQRKKPTPEQLAGIDLLVYDIQDIGVRTYTYTSTMKLAMEAAAEAGIEFWVLDRPNPLGRAIIEGPILEAERRSFVGIHMIPLRYGLTVGELARLLDAELDLGVELRVVPLSSDATADPPVATWVAPSPNIPTPLAALCYAGFVLIEGTNLSEGRGTTRPFQLFGAPWLDAAEVVARLRGLALPGVRFRVTGFEPTFSKYKGELCRGVEVHVTDAGTFRPVEAAVAAIIAVREVHGETLRFRERFFDLIAGTSSLREAILRGESAAEIAAGWADGLAAFEERRRQFLLYE